jgi:hypothetical protein
MPKALRQSYRDVLERKGKAGETLEAKIPDRIIATSKKKQYAAYGKNATS